MKKFIFIFAFIYSLNNSAQSNTTNYFLVRHAEKQVDGTKNPHLTKEGIKRSEQLVHILKYYKINKIYSTNYHRTKETAKPIAEANNVSITTYHPFKLDFQKFLKDTKGKNVLIVGHSNTIPNFVNKLIKEEKYKELSEKVYGNLYIVTVNKKENVSDIVINF